MKMSAAVASANKKSEGVAETIRTVVYALLIAVVIRTVAFEPFNIPSGSLTPTLLTGDYIFVSKYAYGFSRYSLPIALSAPHGRLFGGSPRQGDIVVFINPHTGENWIKRVVGLPGDKVQVRDGILIVNGKASTRERLGDYHEVEWNENYNRAETVSRYHYAETMPNGVQHEILGAVLGRPEDSLPQDNTGVFGVPAGSFFAMGDNRDNSDDSRLGLGFVPFENIVGRAERRFISLEPGAHLWQVWRWPWTLRFARFFGTIR